MHLQQTSCHSHPITSKRMKICIIKQGPFTFAIWILVLTLKTWWEYVRSSETERRSLQPRLIHINTLPRNVCFVHAEYFIFTFSFECLCNFRCNTHMHQNTQIGKFLFDELIFCGFMSHPKTEVTENTQSHVSAS